MNTTNKAETQWYQRNGAAMDWVPAENSGMRPTEMGDARRLKLYPSVGNILSVLANQERAEWEKKQLVLSTSSLARKPGESEEDYAARAEAQALSEREKTSEFERALRQGARRVLQGEMIAASDPLAPWLKRFSEWCKANCVRRLWAERVLVNPWQGYAGEANMLVEHQAWGQTLVEIKVQQAQEGWGRSTYRAWGYRLAALRQALGLRVACANLIFRRSEAWEPVEARWMEAEVERNQIGFEAALKLWCIEKNFEPAQHGSSVVP